ncbi:hypothetical protein EDD18DRAFT_1106224 [Armillaria luteobubalina]|uniref:Uncharacterized protein n=1 Tax=Armillaria luteobubalina TaxID=153913 RepID=A0AA39Q4F1_9AGAR|nr:hypothetical protein EDD18DRAFT_1106224 [Armillaria luteobubalina]
MARHYEANMPSDMNPEGSNNQHSDILGTVLQAPCPREWHFQVGNIVEVIGLPWLCKGKAHLKCGYGLMLRGKGAIITDVKNEEGCTITVVILKNESEILCTFCPQDLSIEGWGEQLDIGQTSNILEQIKGPILSSG